MVSAADSPYLATYACMHACMHDGSLARSLLCMHACRLVPVREARAGIASDCNVRAWACMHACMHCKVDRKMMWHECCAAGVSAS